MGWADKESKDINIWDRIGMGLYAAGGKDPVSARIQMQEQLAKKAQAAVAMAQWKQEMDLKESAEARRAKEGGIRTDLLSKKQAMIDSFLSGGIGDNGNTGANLPPGTTFSMGGLTMPLNRKFTEGESKTLSQASAFVKDLTELRDMFKNKKATPGAQFIGSSTAALQQVPLVGKQLSGVTMGIGGVGRGGEARQNYSDLIGNVSERLLRLRSGAQINEQEYGRFMRMMPSLMRNDKLDIKQLDRFISEFSELQGRIDSGALWNAKSKKFEGGKPTNTVNLDKLFEGLEPTKDDE
jgi:hypothetical protein